MNRTIISRPPAPQTRAGQHAAAATAQPHARGQVARLLAGEGPFTVAALDPAGQLLALEGATGTDRQIAAALTAPNARWGRLVPVAVRDGHGHRDELAAWWRRAANTPTPCGAAR